MCGHPCMAHPGARTVVDAGGHRRLNMKWMIGFLAWSVVGVGMALAADLDDYTPTPRDDAVASLAAKKAEANLLRAELDTKKQDLDRIRKAEDQARADYDRVRQGRVPGPQPENDLEETMVTLHVWGERE